MNAENEKTKKKWKWEIMKMVESVVQRWESESEKMERD